MKQKKINTAWQGAERCKNCSIRHLVLFAGIEEQQFDQMHFPIDELEIDAGQRLYHQNESIPYVYTIRSGLVKLIQHLPDGERRIVRLLGQGDLAGLEGLGNQILDHDAVAMDDIKVCRIPKSVIESLRKDTPALHDALMQRWQKSLYNANNWITKLSTGNSKVRVARLLLLLDETSLDDTFFLPSRNDMGAMLGITTESTSKATAEFKRKGWLKPMQNSRACIDRLSIMEAFE